MQGYFFKDLILRESDKCESFEDYLFKVNFILLIKKNDERAFSLLNKCKRKLSQDFLVILSFPSKAGPLEINSYLQEHVSSKFDRLKIFSGYKQRKRVVKQIDSIMRITDELLKYEKELTSNVIKQEEMLEKIKKIEMPFWRELLSLYVALHSDNSFWANRIAAKLLRMGPYLSLFSGLNSNSFNNQLIVNFLIRTLMALEEKGQQSFSKYLAARFSLYGGDKLAYKDLVSRFSASWSLKDLRGHYANPYLRFLYFDFWIDRLSQRVSESESLMNIKMVMEDRVILASHVKQLWFLKDFFPKDRGLRKTIYNKFRTVWSDGDWIEKYQVLTLINHRSFKELLKKRYPEFKKPNFKIKRDFYLDLLGSGKATHYSLSQLYFLGDRELSHLWWLVF